MEETLVSMRVDQGQETARGCPGTVPRDLGMEETLVSMRVGQGQGTARGCPGTVP